MFKVKKIELLPEEKILLEAKKVKYKSKVFKGSEGFLGSKSSGGTLHYDNELIITNQRIICKNIWINVYVIHYIDKPDSSSLRGLKNAFKAITYSHSTKKDISVIVDEKGNRYFQVLAQREWDDFTIKIKFYFRDTNVILRLIDLFGEKFES